MDLPLTADSEIIPKRMKEGREITDENWIEGSVNYNEYFRTHSTIGDTSFKTLDCSGGMPVEIAEKVLKWLKS